jgi:hypothetical protein
MGVQSTQNVEMFHQSRCFDLCGDALEAVITKVPTIDLISSSRVSREWYLAVHSSLHRYPRHLPWLLLCHYLRPNSLDFTIHAFDPSSCTWLSIPEQSYLNMHGNQVTPRFLSGSGGDRLYTLSLSKLAVSEDPFGARWFLEAEAPKVWRQDAVLAEVGRWMVVAGGGCLVPLYDGEEVRTVEVYDKTTASWQLAEPMPMQFDGSAFSTWLSVASSDQRLYVIERKTGVVSWFDPECKKWGPTCGLNSSHDVSAWAVAKGPGKRLLVVGVGTTIQSKLVHVRIWEVDVENLQVVDNKCEEMPREMVKRLFRGNVDDDATWHSCSVEVCGTERGGYVYNATEMRNGAVFYELEGGEKGKIVRRWQWVPLPRSVENSMGRIEFGCSKVGLGDLSNLSF